MKKIKLLILTIAIQAALILGIGLAASPAISAQSTAAKDAACQGVALTGGSCDNGNPADPGSSANKINKIIATVINIFSLVVGVTSIIMIMVGGFKYVTSGGDSASVSSAKNTILYALIGLVIVTLAQVIVQFVLKKL